MAARTNSPPDIPDAVKTSIFELLDADLNKTILDSLLQGIYTGIVAVTLWYIFMNKSQRIRQGMVIIIILLYIVTAFNFVNIWLDMHILFIDHGQSFWRKYLFSRDPTALKTIGGGVAAATCTILADSTIAGGEAGGGLRAYHHVLEILIESSALYSIALILCTAFFACNTISIMYFDVLAAIARGIAPTLIIGRVAAGHAHPDDSWMGSVISGSLHFRTCSRVQSSRNEDLEAQQESSDEYGHRTLMDSEEDITDDHRCTLRAFQEDIGVEMECLILADHPKACIGRRQDGDFDIEDGICGDELQV
ncbi:uncharacterized protein EV420DRAFT_1765787 [Desarmillaria tabescens]|uniref:Uncharacterized protein n=1 Tax=Armillaria tabescens TaxID=1929756 RepID=A0AA39N1N5_ARMTA|nr:uncharacterized protein EV420DRAFT_1765787 [Desarmillaria tabescens]KAK0454218.1 hypothetical protein EV420DRAFT_1765787 [Desarmillaria tabescens]